MERLYAPRYNHRMRMTGPAPCAWVIGALLLACPMAFARAAAPRDAIRLLPTITHSSSFDMLEQTTANNQGFSDNYSGAWDVRWQPPAVPLGNRANAFLDFYYRMGLKDNLNRMSGQSDDTRGDHFSVTTRLEAPYFGSSYTIEQDDSWAGIYTDINQPKWFSQRQSRANLHWGPPNLPTLDVATSQTYTYPQAGRQPGSESEALVAILQYGPPRGAFGQYYKAQTEFYRSRNFAVGGGSRSNRTSFEGYRELPLGAIGSLVANYNYSEESKADPGSSVPVDSSTFGYGLSLNGKVMDMLGYGFAYSNTLNDASAGTDYSSQYRRFNLGFTTPAPAGKSAQVSYEHAVTDSQYEPRIYGADTNESQKLSWTFRLNPRVEGGVSYELANRTDRVALHRTRDAESLLAHMSYTIPGERGSLNGGYSQGVERSPLTGGEFITTNVDLRTSFNLGQRAQMVLFMNQLYSDNSDTLLALARGTDKIKTGVTYSINSEAGLRLTTTWQQDLTNDTVDQTHTGRSTSLQTLYVDLVYQPPGTAWNYEVIFNSHDDSVDSINIPAENSYATYNTIQAVVRYSF
jgi:hypothetical protein